MAQTRFELKNSLGKYISLEELYKQAKEDIADVLDGYMDNEDALYLGNHIRENNGDDLLYENNEECINDQLDGWEPWDLLQLDYDDYSDYFYLEYGEPEFTNDIWYNLDIDEIAEDILDGSYSSYITSDIQDILDDYEEAKEYLQSLNTYRVMAEETLTKYLNCEADVSDLLQTLDKLVRADDAWAKEE